MYLEHSITSNDYADETVIKPSFGTPTRSVADLVAPPLGNNSEGQAARIWQDILGMIDEFKISDIGFYSGKLWFGIGKRCYPVYERSVISIPLYMALIDALIGERPKLQAAIKLDHRVEQDFSCEMVHTRTRKTFRFRVNLGFSSGMPAVVMRPLPLKVPMPEDIGLDEGMMNRVLATRRGIILITGTTNSGKSTTIAAMLEAFNRRFKYNIVTLEDPIELRFDDKESVFYQREIGEDTLSFGQGLRAAMRQAPHIIFVGEMRDYETVHTACTAAETGHIVLSTTHTDGVALAASRLVDTAPPGKSLELRKLLSKALKLVIYQTLPRKNEESGGGRQCIREVLWVDNAASSMIADSKDKSLNDHMRGNESMGNRLFARAFEEVKSSLDEEDAGVLQAVFAEQMGSGTY